MLTWYTELTDAAAMVYMAGLVLDGKVCLLPFWEMADNKFYLDSIFEMATRSMSYYW